MSQNEEVPIKGANEIEQALKEFEAKSTAEQEQHVAQVAKDAEAPKIVQLVIKWSGNSITQRQAEYVLLGFVVIAMATSLYLFFGIGSSPQPSTPPELFPGPNVPISNQ